MIDWLRSISFKDITAASNIMVQKLILTDSTVDFSKTAPLEMLQRLRSYSRRKDDGSRETWDETCDRVLYSPHLGLKVLGKFTDEEMALLDRMLRDRKAFGSFRFLWVGGTEWYTNPESYPGGFNCSSYRVTSWDTFGMLMELAMMGVGTGAVISQDCIGQLPAIANKIDVTIIGAFGNRESVQDTQINGDEVEGFRIVIGDSRQGWAKAYQALMEIAADDKLTPNGAIPITIDISRVRPKGTPLKGFGGIANPTRLPDTLRNVGEILSKAVGRKLNSVEVCLLIDEAAAAIVAGNIRRSAGQRQADSDDELFANAKMNLWVQDEKGDWIIDPKRDALRMANHTRVFHHKPTLEECKTAVTKMFSSGEGAIMWAGEAIARCNADLLDTPQRKKLFLRDYDNDPKDARHLLRTIAWDLIPPLNLSEDELDHRMSRIGTNPCGEALGTDFFCTLGSVHLNQLDPFDFEEQRQAFRASALHTAAMLQRGFAHPRQQQSREYDPQTLVSFTGAFTFFVKAFGVDWLRWWEAGRPKKWGDVSKSGICDRCLFFEEYIGTFSYLSDAYEVLEQWYLTNWRSTVEQTIWEYCDRHNLKRPNRCTGLKPEGSGSLLTGVGCNGLHPPKYWYYIRRITFPKDDPIALAAIEFGYKVSPSQSDKDESGKLLNDPFSPLCTEWLVEVPVEEEIVQRFPEAASIDPSKFSALAQFDWYMQVQRHYTAFNSSATIELQEYEIEPLAERIYQTIQNDEGYISAALLARFEAKETFPRLPFEPISKDEYDRLYSEVLARRKSDDFMELLAKHDNVELNLEPMDSACSDGLCAVKSFGNSDLPKYSDFVFDEVE